jgi:hypothetical protein
MKSQTSAIKKQTSRVQGYIPKELAKRFRLKYLTLELAQTQALEEAIADWLSEEGAD